MRLKSLLIACSFITGCVSASARPKFNGYVCTFFLNDPVDKSKAICANHSSNEVKNIEIKDLSRCLSGNDCKWIMFDTENFLLFQDSMNN